MKVAFLKKIGLVTLALALTTNAWSFSNLKIGSFNIRNFSTSLASVKSKNTSIVRTNLKILKNIIQKTDADLLAIQEIYNERAFRLFIRNEFPHYKVVLSKCGGRGNQKLGFIYKSSLIQLDRFDEDPRVNLSGGCFDGLRPAAIGHFYNLKDQRRFVALSLHLKAGGSKKSQETRFRQHRIITKILSELRDRGHRNIMLMGDLNTTGYLSGSRAYRKFNAFVDRNRLQNFSEGLNCTSYWKSFDPLKSVYRKSLLDHVMVSYDIADKLKKTDVEVHSHCKKIACNDRVDSYELGETFKQVSDHCPVIATLGNKK